MIGRLLGKLQITRHPGESRDPAYFSQWIPAFAGMTTLHLFRIFLVLCLCIFLPQSPVWAAPDAASQKKASQTLAAIMSAEFELQAGQLDAAASRYVQAALASDDIDLAKRAARVALAASDRTLARSALAHWRALQPDSIEVQTQLLNLALMDGEFETAMDFARILLALPKEAGWPLLLRSLAGSRDDARIIARAVLAQLPSESAMPGTIQPWLAFAGLARRLGDEKTAGRLVDHALARFPDDAEAKLLRAAQLRERGDKAGAQPILIALLEAAPPLTADLRRNAARELALAGNPLRAAVLLGRGVQTDEDYRLRASWLIGAENKAALNGFMAEIAAVNASVLPMRLLLLGHIAEALQLWTQAESWYRQVSGEDAEFASLRLSVVLMELGRRDDAVAVLRELQNNEAADGERVREAFLREAQLFAEIKSDADAMAAYARGLAVFEDDPLILYDRGLYQEGQGRVDAALADLRRIIDQDDDNAAALNAYGYTLLERKSSAQAQPYIERALKLEPDSPAILDSMGWLHFRQGRPALALPLLQKAWSGQPDIEVGMHLGEVLWALARYDEAKAIWREALALDPAHSGLTTLLQRKKP